MSRVKLGVLPAVDMIALLSRVDETMNLVGVKCVKLSPNSPNANDKSECTHCLGRWGSRSGSPPRRWSQSHDQSVTPPSGVSPQRWPELSPVAPAHKTRGSTEPFRPAPLVAPHWPATVAPVHPVLASVA